MNYPFTIIEIRLNANDEGEGKILAGTKVFVDKGKNLVLENDGQQPVRFNEIKKQKSRAAWTGRLEGFLYGQIDAP
jgi:hypothetical protein